MQFRVEVRDHTVNGGVERLLLPSSSKAQLPPERVEFGEEMLVAPSSPGNRLHMTSWGPESDQSPCRCSAVLMCQACLHLRS